MPSIASTNDRQSGRQVASPLPSPLTPLIGRERETAFLTVLLRERRERIVTLTGPGGVGKTRLALHVAARVGSDYEAGAAFVDLSPVGSPDLVAGAIADAIAGDDCPDSPTIDTLAGLIGDADLLLLLDNYEHLLDVAPLVSALASRSPRLTLLVTSRIVLRVRGEFEYALLPLSLPADDATTAADLTSSEAVRLFVERAQSVRPGIVFDEQALRQIATICRRLDGLPLAIELAAARLRVLPLESIQRWLVERADVDVLARGPRDAPQRQRTMRDTIRWSYELLDQRDRDLFCQFAVFAGGCGIQPIEALAIDRGGTGDDAFDAISALVEASLVVAREDETGATRYRMLEPVREFAAEQLASAGMEDAARRWHANYYLRLAEEVAPRPFMPGDLRLLRRLDVEQENLRAALHWFFSTGEHERLIRLAAAMFDVWYYRGRIEEGSHWLQEALDRAPEETSAASLAWIAKGLAMMVQMKGEYDRACELYEQSLAWWEASGDRRALAVVRSFYAGFQVSQGNYDVAEPVFQENLAYFAETDDRVWHAHALFHLGVIAFAHGDDIAAMRSCEEAVDRYDQAGGRLDAIDPLRYLVLAACRFGDVERARRAAADNLQRLEERQSVEALAGGIADVATLAAAMKRWVDAARLFGAAEGLRESQRATFTLPARGAYDAAFEATRTRLDRKTFQGAWAEGVGLTSEAALGLARQTLDDLEGETRLIVRPDCPLTFRELEILRLLATGASNPAIAETLFISRGTVRTHVSSILAKLAVSSRTEAVGLAYREGWL
jgi:predicted ATPase/DNA-binding CsgD family transcriptional regulator